ncbi:MAG: flagellar export chaperone FliS [Candidatus Hydrogenedentes bacterium]|nr:flagellar export chaperone FliS [Candidatus Hydrogenedentota bacterium]
MSAAAQYNAYKRVDVETSSQGKLIVMLFNGAIQRAEEAKRQLAKGRTEGVHNNLLRAQDIVAELRNSLDMKVAIAKQLDRIYEYFQHLLIKANIRKDSSPLDEVITHLTTMRNTWQEAFAKAATQSEDESKPANLHGAAVLNMQG